MHGRISPQIEHRLFSHITMNWRGRPLTSHQVVVSTIAATTTRTGLRVHAELDPGSYATGAKISDAQLAALPLTRHDWHPDWNYTLAPRAAAPPDPAPALTGQARPGLARPPRHHRPARPRPGRPDRRPDRASRPAPRSRPEPPPRLPPPPAARQPPPLPDHPDPQAHRRHPARPPRPAPPGHRRLVPGPARRHLPPRRRHPPAPAPDRAHHRAQPAQARHPRRSLPLRRRARHHQASTDQDSVLITRASYSVESHNHWLHRHTLGENKSESRDSRG